MSEFEFLYEGGDTELVKIEPIDEAGFQEQGIDEVTQPVTTITPDDNRVNLIHFDEEELPEPENFNGQNGVEWSRTERDQVTTSSKLPLPPPLHIPKFSDSASFLADMEKRVREVVGECIEYLKMDPRAYHPFYLRIFLYITEGKKRGFINANDDCIHLWQKFDSFAVSEWKKFEDGQFPKYVGPRSPYLICALAVKGQQVFQEPDSGLPRTTIFPRLVVEGKKLLRKRMKKNNKDSFPDDLNLRLEFFGLCKKLTFPGFISQLNEIWKDFLVGFNMFEYRKKITAPTKTKQTRSPHKISKKKKSKASKINIEIHSNKEQSLECDMSSEVNPTNISEPEPCVSLEETKAKRVQRAAYRSEWLSKKSPKYLDSLRQKARERYFRRKEKMTAEQWANKQARQKFARIEKAVQMTEEERERQRLEDYVKRQAYKAKFTKMEWEEKLKHQRERNKEIYYKKSLDERRKGFAKYREYIRNLPEDKLTKYKENNTKSCRKYMQKLKRENPEKYRMYTVEAFKKNWDKFLESQRKRVESETLEMREKRLLRCRINLAKKRARKKMEKDGILSTEDIEKRLKQVEEEVRNKPSKVSEYKPRLKGRKPHNASNTVTRHDNIDNAQGEKEVEETVQEESSQVEMSQSPILPQQSFQQSSFEVIIPSISFQRVEVIPSQLYVELPLCPPVQIESSDRFESEPVRFEIVIPTSNEVSQSEIHFMDEKESNAPVPVLSPEPVVGKPDNLEPEQPLVKVNVFRQTSPTEDKKSIISNLTPSYTQEMCDECGETFKDKRRLVIHKSTVHNAPSNLTCSKCPHTATSSRALWHHFVTFHCDIATTSGLPPIHTNSRSARTPSEKRKRDARYQDTPNICSECGKQFKQKSTLDDHVRRIHRRVHVHSCSECGVDCQSVVKLWRHKVERHNKRDLPPPEGIEAILCRYCGEIIMRGYEAHVRKKHPESLAEFQQSGENVKLPGSKGKKSKEIEGENVKPTAYGNCINGDWRERRKQPTTPRFENCSYCSKSIRQDLISRHIREHHKKILNCPDCGKHFGEVYKLHEHYREVHAFEQIEKVLLERNMISIQNPSTRAAFCLLCGKLELTEKFSVRSHFVSAHIELFEKLNNEMKPTFPCEFCPDVICSKEIELRTHFQECHPDKSLYCKICGRFRITQAQLATHMAHHKSRAQRHKNICFICQLDLTSKHDGSQNSDDHLRSHVKTVHAEYFFPCLEPNCSTFMYSKEALAAHSTPEEHRAGETMQEYLDNIFGRKKFKCDHCDKFLMLKNLETHRRKMHGLEEGTTFKCPHCPLEFKFFDYLLAHKHIIHKTPVDDIMTLEEKQTISGKISMKKERQLKINSGLAKKRKSRNKSTSPANAEQLSASMVKGSFPEIRKLRRKTSLKGPRRTTKLEEQEENEEQINDLNKYTKTRKYKPRGTHRTRACQLQSECSFISVQSENPCDGEREEVKRELVEVLELHKRFLVRVVRLTEKEIQSYKNHT